MEVTGNSLIQNEMQIYLSSKAFLPQLSLSLCRLLSQTLLVLLSCSLHGHSPRSSADLTTSLHLFQIDLLRLTVLTSQVQDVLTSFRILSNY